MKHNSGVFDRAFFDNIVYHWVRARIDETEFSGELLMGLLTLLKRFKEVDGDRSHFIISTVKSPSEYPKIVEKMCERNNGIDWLNEVFVHRQRVAYEHIIDLLSLAGLKVRVCYWDQDLEGHVHNMVMNIYSLQNFLIFSNDMPASFIYSYNSDAGINLYPSKSQVLTGSGPFKVPVAVRIIIPPGFWGEIKGRSSNNAHFIVPSNVIDAEYTGPLFVPIMGYGEDIQISSGRAVAQLVIHKKEELKFISSVERMVFTEDGARCDRGFGSTNKK